jgi:hypothetical protein
MKKVFILLSLLLISSSAQAWISSYSDDGTTLELYTSFGPFTIYGSTLPVTDMDSLIAMTSTSTLSHGSGIDMEFGYYAFTDFSASPSPVLLSHAQSGYFVNVPNETPVIFSVYYVNSDGVGPLTGYPCVTYWLDGASSLTTAVLDYSSTDANGDCYTKQIPFIPGTYWHYYTVKNAKYASGYTLAQSSFVVTARPTGLTNTGVADAKVVTNGRVVLNWLADNEPNMSYKVYAGKDASSLELVYSGPLTTCELTSLEKGSKYYWQVEAINQYGISSKSTLFTFNTLGSIKKSFNYPNPFSPTGQTTNFVVDMLEEGSAEVTVYSEFGDSTWSGTFTSLPKGQNELKYNGTDDNGNVLYNGTYVAIIKKHYQGRDEQEYVRIMVVK